jgi:hypothetical protein
MYHRKYETHITVTQKMEPDIRIRISFNTLSVTRLDVIILV